jgi:acyl-CoA reductase-like NAD-dependent aldehyde dehydrogenase
VDTAVRAATAAFDGPWRTLPAVERGRSLLRLAQFIRDHAEELSQMESTNIGKPISSARWEIGAAEASSLVDGLRSRHGFTVDLSHLTVVGRCRGCAPAG